MAAQGSSADALGCALLRAARCGDKGEAGRLLDEGALVNWTQVEAVRKGPAGPLPARCYAQGADRDIACVLGLCGPRRTGWQWRGTCAS